MALFDAPKTKKRVAHWRDFSYDFQLLHVYLGVMFALFFLGDRLTVRLELTATVILVAVLVTLSIKHRQAMNWRWPGANPRGILAAVSVIAAAIVVDYAANSIGPRSDPRFLPWHLAGMGLAVFGVFASLGIAQESKAKFLNKCEASGSTGFHASAGPEPAPAAPIDHLWKRWIRGTYYALSALVWLAFMASFGESGEAFRKGSSYPTITNTDPLNSHGVIRYIPHFQKVLINSLDKLASIGIPAVIVTGLILHFFLGIRMFQNLPTYKEWKTNRG